MKYYIVGSVGSGKSTLARKIGMLLKIPVYHLDDVVFERHTEGDRKRSDEEISLIFDEILAQENFIIEDVFRHKFSKASDIVDWVIWLDTPKVVNYFRIIRRFFKQKARLEKSNRPIIWSELPLNFKWYQMFEKRKIEIYELQNLIHLKNQHEVQQFLRGLEKKR